MQKYQFVLVLEIVMFVGYLVLPPTSGGATHEQNNAMARPALDQYTKE